MGCQNNFNFTPSQDSLQSKKFEEFVQQNINFQSCQSHALSYRTYQCVPTIENNLELQWSFSPENTCQFLTINHVGKIYGSPNRNDYFKCTMALNIRSNSISGTYKKELTFLEGKSILGSGFKIAAHYQNFIYWGRNGQLEIWNVSDISQPVLVGVTNTIPDPYTARINGEYLYVMGTIGGTYIHSLKNPASPKLVATSPFIGLANNIRFKNNFAFIAQDSGVGIMDISIPEKPKKVSHLSFSSKIHDVEIDGNTLFATVDKTGLAIIDITQVQSPALMKTIAVTGDARKIQRNQNFLYLTNQTTGANIFDIADVTNPQPIPQSVITGAVNDLLIFDTQLAVIKNNANTQLYDIKLDGTLEFKQNITLATAINSYASDDYLIIPSEGQGGKVFNRNSFTLLADFNTPHTSRDISVRNNLLASNGLSHFHLFDISDPLQPAKIYSENLSVSDIEIRGNNLFVSHNTGLRVYDISVPQTPTQISGLTTTATKNFSITNDLLILTLNNRNIQLIDISNPASPTILSTITDVSTPNKSLIIGNHLFVSAQINSTASPVQQAGLYIYDVSDAQLPVKLSFLETPTAIVSLAIKDQQAYLAGSDRLMVVDITQINAPLVKKEITGFSSSDITIKDSLLYLSSVWAGVRIFDISKKEDPQQKHLIYTGDYTYSTIVTDDHIILANYRTGIHLIKRKDL